MNMLFPFLLIQEAATKEEPGGLLSLHGGLMFWTLAVFLLLWFILQRFAFGPITEAVQAREKALEDAIVAAQADRDEAKKILEQHRSEIEAARGDAQKLIAEGRATGEKIRSEMMEETRAQQQDMMDRARREIDAEKVRAIAELRHQAVDLAIAGAGKVIEKNLDEESNRRIVESFLASIPVAPAKR